MMKDNRTGYFILVYILFFFYAAGTSVIGTFMGDFLDDFGLDVSAGGIFSALYYIGCLTGVVISAFVLKLLQNRTWILVTYGVFSAAMIAASQAATLTVFLTILLIIGISAKFLDLAVNTEVSAYYEKNKGFYVNLLHGVFGAGSFAAPLLAAKLLDVIPKWQMIYAYIGCICFVLFLVFWARGKAPPRTGAHPEQNCMNFGIVKNPKLICLMLAMFFYCGHESGISTWVPLYLQHKYGVNTVTGSFGTSVFWICLVISRLSCAKLVVRFREDRILIIGLTLAILFHLNGVLMPSFAAAIVGYGAAGLFAGAATPLILTLGYREYPNYQSSVSVVFFMSISMGQILFPWVMGWVCGSLGMTAGMLSNVICLIGSVVFVCSYRVMGRYTGIPDVNAKLYFHKS